MSMKELLRRYGDTEVATQAEQLRRRHFECTNT